MVNRRDFNSGLVRLGGALAVAMMTSPGAAQPACAGTLTEQDLRDYLAAVKQTHPTFQICSNWAFTDHMPEPVTAPVS